MLSTGFCPTPTKPPPRRPVFVMLKTARVSTGRVASPPRLLLLDLQFKATIQLLLEMRETFFPWGFRLSKFGMQQIRALCFCNNLNMYVVP